LLSSQGIPQECRDQEEGPVAYGSFLALSVSHSDITLTLSPNQSLGTCVQKHDPKRNHGKGSAQQK